MMTSCRSTHSLAYSLAYSLTHSLTHSPTHSPTHSLTHLLTHSLTYSPTYSLTHLLTLSLTYLLTHSLTQVFAATNDSSRPKQRGVHVEQLTNIPIPELQSKLAARGVLLGSDDVGLLTHHLQNIPLDKRGYSVKNVSGNDENTPPGMLTYSLTHSLTNSLTHSLTYLLTHLLTHSLT